MSDYTKFLHEVLDVFVGKKLLSVSQHDEEDFRESGCFVEFGFENGTARIFTADGKAMSIDHFDEDCTCGHCKEEG